MTLYTLDKLFELDSPRTVTFIQIQTTCGCLLMQYIEFLQNLQDVTA